MQGGSASGDNTGKSEVAPKRPRGIIKNVPWPDLRQTLWESKKPLTKRLGISVQPLGDSGVHPGQMGYT